MEIATILSTVLFLGPGFFMFIISDWIEEPRCDEESNQDSITKSFLMSFLILCINLLVLKFIFNTNIYTFTELLNKIYTFEFFIKYCLLTAVMCFVVALLKPYVTKFVIYIYNKLLNNKVDREYSTYSDLWNYIFYNPEFDISKHVFIIEKSGVKITQGFIKSVSPKGSNKKNIVFDFTDVVKDYFENKDFAKENLSEIVKEYYDFDTDVLIRAYKAEAILEDIDKRIASAVN